MSAKWLSLPYVSPDFEILINDPTFEMDRAWNLWFNIRLTDDPESWDGEIRFINAMQIRMGERSSDHRLIRAHMAEFCRLHPLFPRSIDLGCEEIGAASITYLKKQTEALCKATQGGLFLQDAGRPLNCFKCDGCVERETRV